MTAGGGGAPTRGRRRTMRLRPVHPGLAALADMGVGGARHLRLLRARSADARQRAVVGVGRHAERRVRGAAPGPQMDAATVLDVVERERVTMLTIVGDSMGRPLVEALEADPGAYDTSSVLMLGSGGSIMSGRREGAALRRIPVGHGPDRGHRLLGVTCAGPVRHHRGQAVAPSPAVHRQGPDDGVRRRAPSRSSPGRASSAGWPPRDGCRSATTTTPTSRPGPSSPSTASAGRFPGDMATIEADGSIRLLGRGTHVHQHRGREGLSRGGRGGAEGPPDASSTPSSWVCPIPGSGSGSPRWSSQPAAVLSPARRSPGPLPRSSGRAQGAASALPRRQGATVAVGQARLRLGQGGCGRPCLTHPRHRL